MSNETTTLAAHQTAPITEHWSRADKEAFAMWFALPLSERQATGITDLSDYATSKGMNRSTLYRWRQEPWFTKLTDDMRRRWGQNMTSAVMDGWKLACMKGNPQAIELWLAYFHGFIKKTEVDVSTQNEVSVNDVRYIIDQLPEPLRSKHYGNLRELLDDAAAFERARGATDSSSEPRPEDAIPGEADNHAQDVPGEAADAMAARDTPSVRSRVVRQAQPRHNQSAAWRGEE